MHGKRVEFRQRLHYIYQHPNASKWWRSSVVQHSSQRTMRLDEHHHLSNWVQVSCWELSSIMVLKFSEIRHFPRCLRQTQHFQNAPLVMLTNPFIFSGAGPKEENSEYPSPACILAHPRPALRHCRCRFQLKKLLSLSNAESTVYRNLDVLNLFPLVRSLLFLAGAYVKAWVPTNIKQINSRRVNWALVCFSIFKFEFFNHPPKILFRNLMYFVLEFSGSSVQTWRRAGGRLTRKWWSRSWPSWNREECGSVNFWLTSPGYELTIHGNRRWR